MNDKQKSAKLDWRAIKDYYWGHTREYKAAHIIMLFAYGTASLVAAAAIPLIYKHLMDAVAGADDQVVSLPTLLWLLVLSIVLMNVMFRIGDYIIIRIQATITGRLYNQVMEALMERSYTFYANAFAGSLVAKARRFVRAFEELHDQIIFQIWMLGLQLIISVVVLWYFSWVLGLLFFTWLLLYGILVRYLVQRTVPKSLHAAAGDSDITAQLSDTIANMLTVKMFGAGRQEYCIFQATTKEYTKRLHTSWMQIAFWNSLLQASAVGVFEIILVVVSVLLWQQGVASAGLVLLVVVYAIRSFNIVWMISRNVIQVTRALSDANEMVMILDEPVDVLDPENPEQVRIHAGTIEFTNITHSYNGSGHIFEKFTVSIASGEKIALVGNSGSGKTTLVKLLLRFVDVNDGSITVDGQDITKITQDELRRCIAYVPQEPLLFHRSLYENIAYGNASATQEDVYEAARRAQAHEFIEALENGYETLVGERGVKLSGGERQRVAIARALLKDAPIVVLDEATSSLDSVSETLVQQAFDNLMESRTTIVIAHRLSTIQHMDRILVLRDGAIVEQGTHVDLLAADGGYAELWNHQVGGFLLEEKTEDVTKKQICV